MLRFLMLMYFVSLSESYNILVVFPVPEKRHSVLSDSLVKILLEAGHEVTYVTKFPKETKLYNLDYVDIRTNMDQSSDDYWPNAENTANNSLQMDSLGLKYAQQALLHPTMQEMIMNTTRYFDLVIAEWFYSGLLAPLSSLYDCPLIWYTTEDVSWKSLSLVHLEHNSFSAKSQGLSMNDRIYEMWSELYTTAWNYYHISSKELPAYEKSFRDAFEIRRQLLPNYENIVYNGSMLFINSHPLLSPKSTLPLNAKYIGGHHIEDVVPSFPKNLKKLMDESKDGVIYVDLESNLVNKDIQENIMQELIEAFAETKQTVIWKYDEILVNLPKNLFTIKKPPTDSILNHANIIAFVNYGEMASIIEATHYGVPVIGIPIMEDQLANINSIVDRECGVKVDFNNKLSWKILDAINAITDDKSYRTNAKTAKSIFRHRLTSPQKEFQYWVQMVINTHGAQHLRSRNLQISTLEKYNLDIVLLVLMLIWFFTKVMKVIKIHLNNSDDDIEKKDL